MTNLEHRVLDLDQALGVIGEQDNGLTPHDLGEPEGRETIYALSLTESGTEEFLQERARAERR